MGKVQKKHGKGRLDHYYRLAKEKGYRARSSFKIIQINEKFGHFLEKSKVVIDLCAAPGSWCQVASQLCPINSLIIGVDLAPIKPLPNVITFVSDITTDHCRTQLRGHMKTWKADTVLHDGAPNVGMAWTQDAFTQSELVLQSLKLAVDFLVQGGTFVTKVFRSKDYNNLLWVFQQFFEKVEATKPPSSRNVSAEIFVVCRGFKAPHKVDPRLLDPKYVFEDLQDAAPNYEAKVFNPEKKSRKRQGYEEGDYLQFHTMSALEFVKDEDPIKCLGAMSKFEFDTKKEPELKELKKLPSTTDLLLENFKDLKVLGKKDFRAILKWRKDARNFLGLDKKEEDTPNVEVAPLSEEEQIEKELDELKLKNDAKKKKEKRKANEKRQKELIRQQMNMVTAMDVGIEAAQQSQMLFNLKSAEKNPNLASGTSEMVVDDHDSDDDSRTADEDELIDSDNEIDHLDEELDVMYQQYKERKAEQNARYMAQQSRENGSDDGEWFGFGAGGPNDGDSSTEDSDFESELNENNESQLTTSLMTARKNGLSRKAAFFFDNSIFNEGQEELVALEQGNEEPQVTEIPDFGFGSGSDSEDQDSATEEVPAKSVKESSSGAKSKSKKLSSSSRKSKKDDADKDDFEVVPRDKDSDEDSDDDWTNDKPKKPIVDIVTNEAMTMAHELALGRKSKHDLIDEGYNRYSFRDKDGLPDWFLDDENKHSKIVRPITKEAAEAIKAKLRAMNARPLKKVAEAKTRKMLRAQRRLEKLKKKSDVINDDGTKSEAEKANEISRLASKITKKKEKPKPTLVVARGANKGLNGRPKGIKGKYKMVDGTLKKEQRSLKRIAKKHKKK